METLIKYFPIEKYDIAYPLKTLCLHPAFFAFCYS